MSNFLDSGPKFTGLISSNAGGIGLDQLAFRFWTYWVFTEIFAIRVGRCVKSVQILHVFGPHNFLGEGPEFLDLHYKTQPDIDHVAKFHGDLPRELGDPVAN